MISILKSCTILLRKLSIVSENSNTQLLQYVKLLKTILYPEDLDITTWFLIVVFGFVI